MATVTLSDVVNSGTTPDTLPAAFDKVNSNNTAIEVELNKTFYGTSATPEAVITAGIGCKYINTSTGDQWMKISGTGNTGWRKLYDSDDAYTKTEVDGKFTTTNGNVTTNATTMNNHIADTTVHGNFRRIAVNSGAVSSSGYANFVSRVSNTSMKVLATATDIVLTHNDGTRETMTADVTLSSGIVDYASNVLLKVKGTATPIILPVDGVNVAVSANGIENGHYSSYAAANAFDGNLANYWESAQISSNQLGVSYVGQSGITPVLKRVRIKNYTSAAGNMPSVKIQYANSATPTTWVDIVTASGLDTTANAWNDIDLPAYTPIAPYSLRVLANANIAGGWVVNEIELYTTFNSLLDGYGVPAASLGENGDYYTDIATLLQYKKAAGAWAITTPFVPLGEGIKAAGTLASPCKSYALNGKYISPIYDAVNNTNVNAGDNIGTANKIVTVRSRFDDTYQWSYQQRYFGTSSYFGFSPTIKDRVTSSAEMATSNYVGYGSTQGFNAFPDAVCSTGEVQLIVERCF